MIVGEQYDGLDLQAGQDLPQRHGRGGHAVIDPDLADTRHGFQRPALLGADEEQERPARRGGVPHVAALLGGQPRVEQEVPCDARGVTAGGELDVGAPGALPLHVGDDRRVGLGRAEGGQESAGEDGEGGRGATREHGGQPGR